ncbi:uncharacterized protein N7479_008113 [Penicillium vulpinum]|uniref:uncharacterized protein n=1 Tax=Penicillium vulpinum TaxID=29845 RepID=UPI002547121A|nr:uncharacterized protein N7479_008113 [Penicillium vulpinum]KAJ5960963.1 hypothetical protein N7479_008113 [Penicillium vulpinum]
MSACCRRGLIKKQQEEEALARLPLNTLFIVHWIRSDPPPQNDFHWGYYFHTSTMDGTEYHMRNLGGGWIPDHGPTGGFFKSNFLCVLVQVAIVPGTVYGELDRIMRPHDGDVNSIPGVTCRVLLMRILEKLTEQSIVRCRNFDALLLECMAIGNQYSASAAINQQPRPVVRSRLCL